MAKEISSARAEMARGRFGGIETGNQRGVNAEVGTKPEHFFCEKGTWTRNLSKTQLEAASGFEPLHRGFADLSLNHLGAPPCSVS